MCPCQHELPERLYYRKASHSGAMLSSRTGEILAEGGILDEVTVWRPAEVGCSAPLLTVVITKSGQKATGFFRFPEKKIYFGRL